MSADPIRSVLVLGGGITAFSAAAAFARSLPQVAVTLVETPLDPAALTDRLPGSAPSIARFHALIGLDEAELIGTGAATWRVGTRFRHWSASGHDWIDFTGECGPRIGTIDFHQLWARAARSGETLPYHAYAMAGALAEAGKFVLPTGDSASPLASYDYALRIVPDRYREVLARHCGRLKVARVQGAFAAAETGADGAIDAVMLADRRRLSADLYVDCGGPAAPLLSRAGGDFEAWSAWLPTCGVVVEPGTGEPGAIDRIERTATGWRWDAPGAGSGRIVAADDPVDGAVPVRPGRQRAPWRRNVVAIGDAAAGLDPLGWAGLRLAHAAIELALALLPDRGFHRVELAEYNRRAAANALALRDLAALFYHCPNAPDARFWRDAAALEIPDSLADALEQFQRRGYVTPLGEGLVHDNWLPALVGLGHLPERPDALSSEIPRALAASAMAQWAEGIAAIPPRLPAYRDYLAETCRRLRDPGGIG
jgi:tryptophan halogenase